MHKILTSEVNLKFGLDVSFLLPNYCINYTVLELEPFKLSLRLLVRMNVSTYAYEQTHTFPRTALSFTNINCYFKLDEQCDINASHATDCTLLSDFILLMPNRVNLSAPQPYLPPLPSVQKQLFQ